MEKTLQPKEITYCFGLSPYWLHNPSSRSTKGQSCTNIQHGPVQGEADQGRASNLMRVLISLAAPDRELIPSDHILHGLVFMEQCIES